MNPKRRTKQNRKLEAQKYITYLIAKGEQQETLQSLWEDYITDLTLGGEKIDIYELVQSVLGQAYLKTNSDIQAYARKVSFYNETRKQIREEIDRLRSLEKSIENEIKNFEETLNTTGDDAQLANIDLQNALQKQQQLLQMMSSISKLLQDTALAVIQKIGG